MAERQHRNELALLCVLSFLSACQSSFEYGVTPAPALRNGGPDEALTDSALAFSKSLYPALKEQCGSCHGLNQAPIFISDVSIQSTHDTLLDLNLVSMDNLRGSRIIQKIAEGHKCWTNCRDDSAEVLELAEAWKSEAQPKTEIRGFKTAELVIPSTISNLPRVTNAPLTLQFPLAGIAPGVPSSAVLGIYIRNFDDFSYEFSNLQIKSEETIHIKGINIYINGANAKPGSAYSVIEGTFAATGGTPPGSRYIDVSTAAILVPKGLGLPEGSGGAGIDTIVFSFDLVGAPPSQSEQRWANVYDLLRTNCNSCHRVERTYTNNNAGGQTYTVPAFGLYSSESEFLSRMYPRGNNLDESPRYLVVPGNAIQSALWRSVAHQVDGQNYAEVIRVMPPGAAVATRRDWATELQNWINNLP